MLCEIFEQQSAIRMRDYRQKHCATMLLSINEVNAILTILSPVLSLTSAKLFTATTKHAWVKHVGGACKLMQIRSSQRINTDFDRAMLMSFRGQLVLNSSPLAHPSSNAIRSWKP
jgi:hypothetical protein